ncbi:MAG TPA: S9 family peptidase [Rhizomicrobium sp.]|jgi:dipeptidyl aminopeptidase/acylaminoacyl peptidase
MKRIVFAGATALALLLNTGFGQTDPVAKPGSAIAQPAAVQIPRSMFFGNPSRAAATVSPDGRNVAFLAPRNGVLNIWVAPVNAPDKARPLSDEKTRPIPAFFWAPDSSRLLYLQDTGGTENYLLYGVSLDGKTQAYTPFDKTRVEPIAISPDVKDAVLIGINNRDPQWHDVYKLNPTSGKLTLVWQNPGGYSGVVAERKLHLVLAQKSLEDGGSQIERFGADGKLTPVFKFGLEDSLTTAPLGATDSHHVYFLDSRNRDTAALDVLNPATGATKIVAEDAKADLEEPVVNPMTGEPEAYTVNYLRPVWHPLGKTVATDIDALNTAAGNGLWRIASQSDDDRIWTVQIDRITEPSSYYLYDRGTKKLTKLFTTRPELEGKPLAPMYPLEIKARDGLTLVSYLSLPPGSDKDGDGVPDHPLPMVLFVHGGPWGRDVLGYGSWHQWLANRGYAVLSVNYRASTGFGKAFISAGDLQWGRKMHDDLLDAVDYAVDHRITTPDMVAIAGGSYGGYATLAGVTMTPDKFRCGVDIVGPSNLFTLLQTIPPYWKALFNQFAQRMGDPRTDAGRAMLKERSPLTYVDQIKVPLLIGAGANDPRVNKRESDQIVAAMKAKGIPVTYVLFPDEGHGFHRPENNIAFNAVAESFLGKCLGGAVEPIGADFHGSSITVPEGAANVAGVQTAMASQQASR